MALERPIWILRSDRIPEKVEARGQRRKVEIPADVTHWCHEGDREWTSWWKAKPSGFAMQRGDDEPTPNLKGTPCPRS
jgi:hypothetical protein